MGRHKWDLREGALRWVDIAAAILGPLCERVVVSVSEVSGGPMNHETLHDLWPSRGPLSAWGTFAAVFPGRDLLSLPVDMPGVTTEDMAAMIRPHPVYLQSSQGPHYLTAFVPASHLQSLPGRVAREALSARNFWNEPEAVIHVVEGSRGDRNTPADAPLGL